MSERQSYLVTARLPLGLIASRPRQVSEHTFLMGHTHNQVYTDFFLKNKGKNTRENDTTGKKEVIETGNTIKRKREREGEVIFEVLRDHQPLANDGI